MYFPGLKERAVAHEVYQNFQSDAGIPSTNTLLEYKFVTSKPEAKRVVDEILADASGYRSPQWRNLLYVIYETHRVNSEEEWTALLRDCELGSNYQVVVLHGDAE